jgi:hypothetical protein
MPELRTKKKWKELNPNLSKWDLVLELDKDIPRGEWRLAIIQEVIPSLDKNVRKIRIKNSAGSFIRPITQVCFLELNSNKKFISEAEVINHVFCKKVTEIFNYFYNIDPHNVFTKIDIF